MSAAYGALALVTLATVWPKATVRDGDPPSRILRLVGVVLLFGYFLSNVGHEYLSRADRPALYTVIEIIISTTTFLVYFGRPSRYLFGVIFFSAISILSNILFAFSAMGHDETVTWQWITNGCFAAECLLAMGAGMARRERGLFDRRFSVRRRAIASPSHARGKGRAA